ncbi:YitT family protein [Paenibacillus wenxiniae]|uniref:YitT family protein n=1 Tax=Paenibacillus wenxiniae TaxID=1636843 RepID=A0ABW4RF63_9BACL
MNTCAPKRLLAIVAGCVLVSLGLLLLRHAQVVTDGTAGLALSLSYLLQLPFALLFFMINIPFYVFSFVRMGWSFTLSTILAVCLVSLVSSLGVWLPLFEMPAIIGTMLGSVLCGFGLSVLFMNRASLGGVNIVALFLQQRLGWNPGIVNFVFDSLVVCIGFYSVGWYEAMLSALSVVIVSGMISYFKQRIARGNPRAAAPRQERIPVTKQTAEAVSG